MQSIFQKLGEWLEELFKFLASLKLAVIIILSLGIVSAIGTIVEARFDAVYAQKTVYHSPWMYAIMALLCVNLINVMIDRLPWKRHHAGFIFAHVGIIVLIAGSLVTKIYGVDGSMSLDIDSKSRVVMLPDTDFFVASSLGGEYRTIYNSPVDFITRPPNKTDYTFPLGDINLKVLQYYHFAVRDEKIMPSESLFDGPAIRFQLENDNVNVTDWILKSGANPFEVFELGPAKVILTSETTDIGPIVGNTLVLRTQGGPTDLPPDKISYEVFTESRKGQVKRGTIQPGDFMDTGWMGLKFRLLKYIPRAERRVEYLKRDSASGITTQAVQIDFNNKKYWIGLNSSVRLYTDIAGYLISFRNRVKILDFDVHLKKFYVGRYQGTNRAMSYESDVFVEDLGEVNISMNNPMKHDGYTFYQASFQENEMGEAVTSILSVNQDPGRFWKYLGSLLIVLGCIIMFYFKHYRLKIFGTGKGGTNES